MSVVSMKARTFLGVEVRSGATEDAVAWLDAAFAGPRPLAVAFANANLLNHAANDPALRAALGRFLVLNDGIGVELAGRILYGEGFPANLNGTDLIPVYLDRTREARRIYLLGADAETVGIVAERLGARHPRHAIVGFRDGYFPPGSDAAVTSAIRATGADLLLVALGNPRQEMWLDRNLAATGCRLGLCVGGLFDFIAGRNLRAPPLVRSLGGEWLFRMAQEPRRLARRYLLGNPAFLYRVARQKMAARNPA